MDRLTPFQAVAATPAVLDVWVVDLDSPRLEGRQLASYLSRSELERARRFRFARDRDRFVKGRGAARCILARYVDQEPARLRIESGRHGKPELLARSLAFNIGHAGPVFVLAIHPTGPVGIDVELPNVIGDVDGLAATVLTDRELREFERVPESEKLLVFYHAWTLKEAVLKYLGHGFSTPPTAVQLDFPQGGRPVLGRVEAREWLPEQAEVLGPIALGGDGADHSLAICHAVVPVGTGRTQVRPWPHET